MIGMAQRVAADGWLAMFGAGGGAGIAVTAGAVLAAEPGKV